MGPAAGHLNAVRTYRLKKERNLLDYRSNRHVVKTSTPPGCLSIALQQNALLTQCTFQNMSFYHSQYKGYPLHHVLEHRSCHGTFRRIQAFCAVKPPCSGTS